MGAFGFLENVIGAFLVCVVLIFVVGLVNYGIWLFVFSAAFSYVASDAIMNLIIHGGGGFAKIGWDNAFAERGHAFIAFFGAIVGSTAIVAWFLSQMFLVLFGQATHPPLLWIFLLSLFAGELVVIDLELRFYER